MGKRGTTGAPSPGASPRAGEEAEQLWPTPCKRYGDMKLQRVQEVVQAVGEVSEEQLRQLKLQKPERYQLEVRRLFYFILAVAARMKLPSVQKEKTVSFLKDRHAQLGRARKGLIGLDEQGAPDWKKGGVFEIVESDPGTPRSGFKVRHGPSGDEKLVDLRFKDLKASDWLLISNWSEWDAEAVSPGLAVRVALRHIFWPEDNDTSEDTPPVAWVSATSRKQPESDPSSVASWLASSSSSSSS